jgi:hypothetical protein
MGVFRLTVLTGDQLLKRLFIALVALMIFTACSCQPAGDGATNTDDTKITPTGDNTGPGLAGDPVINRFTVTPSTIQPGGKAKLSWYVSNAASVSINQDIGIVDKVGSIEVSPMVQTAYIITAINEKGSTFAKVTLSLQAQGPEKLPVVLEFVTDPVVPKKNTPARLIWKTRGATQVTIDNVPVQANGDKMVMLSSPTSFMIMVTNSFGSEIKYLSVQVND